MTRWGVLILTGLCALVTGLIAGVLAERAGLIPGLQPHSSAAPNAEVSADPPEPGVPVQVTSAVTGRLDTAVEMLGSVERIPGASIIRSLASDVLVVARFVELGQPVTAETPVLRVEPTRSVLNQLDAAQAAADSAQMMLESARSRLDAKLGTRSEVVQAEQAVRAADVELAALRSTLPTDDGILRAGTDGVLLSAGAPTGSVVLAGTPLCEIAKDGDVAVRFGLPPESAERLPAGSPLTVVALLSESRGSLKVSLDRTEQSMGASSRSIAAWTGHLGHASWLPGTPVRVTARITSDEGLLLPRGAVVLSDEGPTVFTVRDGSAHRHSVAILAGNADSVCVAADDLLPGELVVVLGGHELEDGTRVRVESAP